MSLLVGRVAVCVCNQHFWIDSAVRFDSRASDVGKVEKTEFILQKCWSREKRPSSLPSHPSLAHQDLCMMPANASLSPSKRREDAVALLEATTS